MSATPAGNGPLELERAVTKQGSAAKRFGENNVFVQTREELQKRAAMRAGRCVWYKLSRGDESYLCVVLIRDLQIDLPKGRYSGW